MSPFKRQTSKCPVRGQNHSVQCVCLFQHNERYGSRMQERKRLEDRVNIGRKWLQSSVRREIRGKEVPKGQRLTARHSTITGSYFFT